MRTKVLMTSVFLASAALAGDEWQSPALSPNSSYVSTVPAYRLVGVERIEKDCTAWVVADEVLVHQQRTVNRIVASVRNQLNLQNSSGCALRIHFYRAVHAKPRDPSFRITEQLGAYDSRDNKTMFLGDNEHYGMWAYGPSPQ